MQALIWLGLVLAGIWLLGSLVFHVASGLIHLLLLVAVVLVVLGFLRRGRTA